MRCRKRARKAYSSNKTWANWTELNPELLYIISRKLCDISSFIIFRTVCKAWRDATDISDPPRQFPCLIDWPYLLKGSSLRVYSPASHRTHTFHVPNTSFYGPAGQDVLILSESDKYLSYLNPLTRVKKNAPFDEPFSFLEPVHVGFSSKIEEFVMVKYIAPYDAFYFKRSEQDQWTSMTFGELTSAACYENRYFLLENSNLHSRIVVIDENDKPELASIPFPNNGFYLNYLIATSDGLLAVSASIPQHLNDLKESRFEVQRLENYPRNPQWNKLSSIGDLMLFMDHSNCFSLKAGDYSGFKGNCIYFITRCRKAKRGTKHVIGKFDMGRNEVEEISGPAWLGKRNSNVKAAWFVPSM